MAKTEDILLRIGSDVSGLRKGTSDGKKALKDFEGQVDSTVKKLAGMAATLGLGLGFAKLIGDALEFADTITRVAEQTGLSTDAVQRLNFIATQTGTTLDAITGGIGKMQKNLVSAADGGKAAAEALQLMGIDAVQFLKLNPDEQFTKAAEAIASIKNPADKTASSMALFGKAGADLIPTLDAVGKKANELNAQFDAIGGPVSAEAIAAVDKLGDTAAATGIAAKNLATNFLAWASPVIIDGLTKITELLGGIAVLAGKGGNAMVDLDMQIGELDDAIKELQGRVQTWDTDGQETLANMIAQRTELTRQWQELADAPMKAIQAQKAAAALAAQTSAQELEDIVVHEKAKTTAILDAETERHLRQLEARGTMLAELEAQIRESDIRINEESLKGLNAREQFVNSSYKSQATTIFGELAGITAGVAQHNKTLFKINKAAGIANAVIATYEGVAQSLKAYPMPLAGIMAAVHLAAGLANVMAIKNQQYNGGGSGSAPSNATTVPTPTTPAGGGQGAGGGGGGSVMRVEGMSPDALFTGKFVRGFAERLAEHQKDGGTVLFS